MKLNFRPLEKADFPQFATWLAEPHVSKWWQEPATIQHVEEEYGGCTRGDLRTRVYIVELGNKPIGVIQSYMVDDYPEHAKSINGSKEVGIDYFIGDPEYVGRGYGGKMISDFIDDVVRGLYPEALGVVADPEVKNIASVRALAKAGFKPGDIVPGEHGPELLMKLALH
jgi:aminoglycoside 6'-N-acetyltransferase